MMGEYFSSGVAGAGTTQLADTPSLCQEGVRGLWSWSSWPSSSSSSWPSWSTFTMCTRSCCQRWSCSSWSYWSTWSSWSTSCLQVCKRIIKQQLAESHSMCEYANYVQVNVFARDQYFCVCEGRFLVARWWILNHHQHCRAWYFNILILYTLISSSLQGLIL